MKPLFLIATILLAAAPAAALAADGPPGAATRPSEGATGWGYLAAALAVGLGSIGAGFAVGPTASAAVGAVAEKDEMTGRALVFVGLAEGIAIYGLVVALMILTRM